MRIKVLFVLVCLGSTLTGCAQDYPELRNRLRHLQNLDAHNFTIDSTGFSSLANPVFYSKHGKKDAFIIEGKNVHFLDFNNDGHKDIIYQSTYLQRATILFSKNGNDYREIWSGPGKPIDIKTGEETTVLVRADTLGCLGMSLLFTLNVKQDNTVVEDIIGHLHETNIQDLDDSFEPIVISGILRTHTVTDDKEKYDACWDETRRGNKIESMFNDAAIVLKKQGEWLLVLSERRNNNRVIGWIKKEDE